MAKSGFGVCVGDRVARPIGRLVLVSVGGSDVSGHIVFDGCGVGRVVGVNISHCHRGGSSGGSGAENRGRWVYRIAMAVKEYGLVLGGRFTSILSLAAAVIAGGITGDGRALLERDGEIGMVVGSSGICRRLIASS